MTDADKIKLLREEIWPRLYGDNRKAAVKWVESFKVDGCTLSRMKDSLLEEPDDTDVVVVRSKQNASVNDALTRRMLLESVNAVIKALGYNRNDKPSYNRSDEILTTIFMTCRDLHKAKGGAFMDHWDAACDQYAGIADLHEKQEVLGHRIEEPDPEVPINEQEHVIWMLHHQHDPGGYRFAVNLDSAMCQTPNDTATKYIARPAGENE